MGNPVQDKSFQFALRIIEECETLNDQREYVLSKQLLKCGTSIGANVEEALGGQSRADFIAKLSIAYKEARETKYWLKLLQLSSYAESIEIQSLLDDADELCRIIAKIILTSKVSRK